MPDQIEKNLLLFLDPTGEMDGLKWRFVAWRNQRRELCFNVADSHKTGRTVYCFDRCDLIGYLLFPWYVKKRGLPGIKRKVLYVNDGLLSSIFDSDKTAGYRAFAACHLPRPAKLRQKLVSFLPLALRAEKRYVVVGEYAGHKHETLCEEYEILEGQDFMFFSNAPGKLLLTTAETLRSGKGLVIKTTASPTYAEAMGKEFATMFSIATMQGKSISLPHIGKRFNIKNRVFFTEEYVKGRNLREILHSLARKNDIRGICGFLDRLDEWFNEYISAFRGEPRSLPLCYEHLFVTFSELYGAHQRAHVMLENARRTLAQVAQNHGGVVTVTAHNDLWPGNFVVGVDRLIAVDWERAVENRAPLFDYYWMIISTALEYLVCRIGIIDYSKAFRLFLDGKDDVSRHANQKLKLFLCRLALDKELHHQFLLLFLMELSVQGYLALGSQTAMDRLAFGELVNFVEGRFEEKLNC